MSITMVGSVDPVVVGQPLAYAMTVKQGGECDGTGVTVTDTLPPGVTFVTATTSRGSWKETNGVVKFNLGFFTQGATTDLSVTVMPTVAGSITNTARVRSNEPDARPENNVAGVETTVTDMRPRFTQSPGTYGSVMGSGRPRLSLVRSADRLVQVQLTGAVGRDYTIEVSTNLVDWRPWTNFVSTAPTMQVTEPLTLDGAKRFYRAVVH